MISPNLTGESPREPDYETELHTSLDIKQLRKIFPGARICTAYEMRGREYIVIIGAKKEQNIRELDFVVGSRLDRFCMLRMLNLNSGNIESGPGQIYSKVFKIR